MRKLVGGCAVLIMLVGLRIAPASGGSPSAGAEVFGGPAHVGHPAGTPRVGFQDQVALTGLTFPTVVQFARDGRIFVGEKSGVILSFHGFNDPSPTVFADLSTNVYDYG